MEKNLLKLDNEPLDDDFEKLFMDYLKEELSSDDSNTDKEDTTDGDANDDEEDNSLRFGGERNYMPEIKQVEIQVQPQLFGTLYVNGDIAVTIRGNEEADFTDERFQLHILGEGFYPMATSKAYKEVEHPEPGTITLTMMSFVIWLPDS